MTTKQRQASRKTKAGRGSGPIRFEATLLAVGRRMLVRLPKAASQALPSRGQVAAQGTINGHAISTVIEPDGDFGHWVSVEGKLAKAAGAAAGKHVTVEVEPCEAWPEPRVPADLRAALDSAPREVQALWRAITPMARWEWVRWVNATKNSDTRARRVEVSISKLTGGKRRPCCFNLASCTDPELARSGKLAVD